MSEDKIANWISGISLFVSLGVAVAVLVVDGRRHSSNQTLAETIESKNRQTAIMQIIYDSYNKNCSYKVASITLLNNWFNDDLSPDNIGEAKNYLSINEKSECKTIIDSTTKAVDDKSKAEWLVVFSNDPGLDIHKENISAEFEIKLAQDKLYKNTLVIENANRFLSAIAFDNKNDAVNEVNLIKKKLNRETAFVESLEAYCKEDNSKEKSFKAGNKTYSYTLHTCK